MNLCIFYYRLDGKSMKSNKFGMIFYELRFSPHKAYKKVDAFVKQNYPHYVLDWHVVIPIWTFLFEILPFRKYKVRKQP